MIKDDFFIKLPKRLFLSNFEKIEQFRKNWENLNFFKKIEIFFLIEKFKFYNCDFNFNFFFIIFINFDALQENIYDDKNFLIRRSFKKGYKCTPKKRFINALPKKC